MGEAPAHISREYVAGDDWSLQFTAVDADGNALNITGFTAKFEMARRVGGTPVISTESGSISPPNATATLTTPASGIYTIALDAADTAGLEGDYYFESEVVDTSSDESTTLRGYITVAPSQL